MEEVISGKDDVLFLTGSVHKIMDHMTGKASIPEYSLVNFHKNLESRRKYCEDRGINYRHVIYPDKISVMKSFFPVKGLVTYSDRYRPYFTDSVLDLQNHIPDENSFFFETDTHLNFKGKVETSLVILKEFFDLDVMAVRDVFNSFKGAEQEMVGDLGGKLDPVRREVRTEIKTSFLKRYHNQVGGNDGFAVICLNKDKLKEKGVKRLLIFGDSFCERTLQFLSYMYSEILFCRSRYFHEEIVDMFKPDDVITESAERYFSGVRLDELSPRFNLIYGLKESGHSTDSQFYMAMNAVLNYGRPQHKVFVYKFLSGKI
jgi:hypothetical protein